MTHSHMVLALPWMVIQDGTSLEDHFEGTDWHTQLERLHCSGLLRTTGYQMAVLLGCSPPFRKGMFVSTVPKSASSTFLVWLATLEGRSEANLLAALAARRCLEHTQDPQRAKSCFAKALYHRYANYSSRLPGLNLEAFGCHRSDVNALADYGLRFQQDMRTGWLVVPPFMCQQCCTQGYGRLLVVLGRNPYMRLASYFQRRTGPKVPGSKAVDWSKFKGWVRLLHNITTNTNSFQTLRGVPHLIGSDDLLHLRSAKEMLDDARILPGRSQRDFTVVHQETLEADLKALERQLCRRFGSCSALPPLPKQKERSERSSCGTPGRPRKCCNKWRLNHGVSKNQKQFNATMGVPMSFTLLIGSSAFRPSFGQHCDDTESSCAARTVAFNLVFTVGGATNVSGALFCGLLVDSCGPRGGILTGLVLIIIGSILLGFSDVESEFTWPLAYVFYGLGGCCVHLSSFSLGNAFGRSKGLVISMLVAMFSISALLFQGFDLCYRAGMSRNAILLVHVGLEALNFGVSAWLWPTAALAPGTELRCRGCRIVTSEKASTRNGLSLKELCRNAWRTALTAKFLCFLVFHFSQIFLNRCLMGWMEAELRWKSQRLSSGLDVEFHLALFNVLQSAAGFIAIPLFSYLVGRYGHRHAPFCATALLAVVFLSVRPFASEWLLPVLYMTSACHRQMFFSTFFTFISSEYPGQLFATLSGFANVLAGLGTTLQTPLLATALRHLDGDFMVLLLVQLGFAILVLLSCILLWWRDTRRRPASPHDAPEHHGDATEPPAEAKAPALGAKPGSPVSKAMISL
ncbi:Large neutral amino acids transporter small subunit 3 (L-type amino acid transporter 3) (Solute carrier family 43 member 1) [Durusdinium trenchii]|uniref:Large neutral amino acids transporter small subunit 3 (L-type amino acid transporter 3) (Solute carrier family 43 member 1) n=1 Tax=Durusdinium trenchii TaxID=1381693 RepID=A0ABP0QC46_9DINO